jgi:hypothetical protein
MPAGTIARAAAKEHGGNAAAPGIWRHHDLVEIAACGIDGDKVDQAAAPFGNHPPCRRPQFVAPAPRHQSSRVVESIAG